MSTTRIRRAQPSDAAALATFAARLFRESFGPDNRAEDLEAYLASAFGTAQQAGELANPDVVTLIACDSDALQAYAQLRRNPPPACVPHEGPIELRRFYVEPSAQGRGLAQRLMAAVRTAATGLGARHLWLGVWEHNPRALAFYRKEGFADVGRIDFQLGADRQTDRVLVAPAAPALSARQGNEWGA